jgi:hypothetical protein
VSVFRQKSFASPTNSLQLFLTQLSIDKSPTPTIFNCESLEYYNKANGEAPSIEVFFLALL